MKRTILTLTPIALAVMLSGCNDSGSADTTNKLVQPTVQSKVHALLSVDGYQFRDANGNGTLEPYEDWRLTAENRAADLVTRMSRDADDRHAKCGLGWRGPG